MFQQKGEVLTISVYNLPLNCPRWKEWSLYTNWQKLEMIEVVCKGFVSVSYLCLRFSVQKQYAYIPR